MTDNNYGGRKPVSLEDGREVVYYDPTEAVEEHAASRDSTKTIGGLAVDEGEILDPKAVEEEERRSPGKTVAVPMRGQEEPFGHLVFPFVVPVSASTQDEAMSHARRYLSRAGLEVSDFLSFDITTHYYLAALGKRVCGWSFTFHSKPFRATPHFEIS